MGPACVPSMAGQLCSQRAWHMSKHSKDLCGGPLCRPHNSATRVQYTISGDSTWIKAWAHRSHLLMGEVSQNQKPCLKAATRTLFMSTLFTTGTAVAARPTPPPHCISCSLSCSDARLSLSPDQPLRSWVFPFFMHSAWSSGREKKGLIPSELEECKGPCAGRLAFLH